MATTNYKQDNLNVGQFSNKLMTLRNELVNHGKVLICTYEDSECEVVKKLSRMYKEDKSHQFLMGLNDDEFLHVRSPLLTLESLPQLDKIFNVGIGEP